MKLPRLTRTPLENYGWQAALVLGMLLLYAHFALRYAGAYPAVFADEQVYSNYARLAPPGEAPVPSWLYFATFRLTNACGPGFLDCARYLNLLFFIGAASYIFGAARTVASRPLAVLVALAAIAAPASIYASYFMPESMYYFGFAVLAWVALLGTRLRWYFYAIACGTVLGLLALVKVHALFLLPALALFTLFVAWRGATQRSLLTGSAAALVCIVTAVAVKTAAGYALAGPAGLGLFGNLYGEVISIGANAPLSKSIGFALVNLKGILLSLAMLFGVPLAVLLHYLASARARAAAGPAMAALVLFTILMLGTVVALCVGYTASIAVFVPSEGLRLHSRYFNFALVLLLMLAAAAPSAPQGGRPLRAAIAIVLGAVIGYAATAVPSTYLIMLVDNPELFGLGLGKPGSMGIAILVVQVALLGLWVARPRFAGVAFLALLMPLLALNAHNMTREDIAKAHKAGPSDVVGQVARAYLGEQSGDVRIMGDNAGEMIRIQFQLDAAGIEVAEVTSGWPLEEYAMPGRKRWLLLTNEHRLPAGYVSVLEHPHFRLVRTRADNRSVGAVNMTAPVPNALLQATEGIAVPEHWGRRTEKKEAKLIFAKPLPKKATLFLTGFAISQATAGVEVVVRVGAHSAIVKFPPQALEVHLPFETDGTLKTVTLEVAKADAGVGLVRVEVGERGTALR